MPYIIYHTTDGPLAYVDGPAYRAIPGDGEMIIPCEAGADVADRERWDNDAAIMRQTGAPAPTMALVYEYLQGIFDEKIEARFDAFARTEIEIFPGVMAPMYGSMDRAVSYANDDEEPEYDIEGKYCKKIRTATWKIYNAIVAAVMAGERPIPTWDELEAELPPLAWPEGSRGYVPGDGGA